MHWRAPDAHPSPPEAGPASAADGARPDSWFRRLSEWILARPAPSDERERLQSDIVLAFALSFIGFGFLVLFAIHFVFPVPAESRDLARITTPLFMVGLAISIGVFRRIDSVALAAQITNGTVFVVLGTSVAFHGGLESTVLVLFPLLPTVAGLLAGRNAAVFWSAVSIAFLVALREAELAGVFTPTPIPSSLYTASIFSVMTIACSAATGAVFLYERINADLRRRLEAERQKLRHEAGHDPLTGLANRRLFPHLQDQALRRADRTKQKVALFVVDLDGFKPLNDNHGHAAGDRMLRAVAERLRSFTRSTDTVARLGGDEFAILVELLDTEDDAQVFANRLLDALSVQVAVCEAHTAEMGASIGVALYPDHGETPAELHEAADLAMYDAKAAGGGCYRISAD